MSDALAAAIEGEQAATYAYGLAGPHIGAADRDLLLGGLAAHRSRILALRLSADDTTEPGSPAGYEAASPETEEQARALLADVEAKLSAAYADLAAASSGAPRTDAVMAARECAVRSVSWGGAPQAFPGR